MQLEGRIEDGIALEREKLKNLKIKDQIQLLTHRI